jgi:hypothetical protein
MEKEISELSIRQTDSIIQSIEVDADEESNKEIYTLLRNSLVSFAESNKDATATVYNHFGHSVDFGRPSTSEFMP